MTSKYNDATGPLTSGEITRNTIAGEKKDSLTRKPVITGAGDLSYRRKTTGFTLIELMITLVIIGIIAAIAYPNYTDSVRKSRRSDGKALLGDVAARMEQFYMDRKTYVGATPTALGIPGATSREGYYTLTIPAANLTATSYLLQATATIKGGQNKDSGCSPMTLNHLGTKGPTGCW